LANTKNLKKNPNTEKRTQSPQSDGPDTIKERLNRMEKLIAKRTSELKEVNESLQRQVNDRKDAEVALRESEEKYHNLFQQSNDAIFIHDLSGRIIDTNQKVLDLFGYTKQEILSLNMSDLHPITVLSKSKLAFDTISQSGSVNFEIDFKKKNGDIFPAEVSAGLFEASGQIYIQGIVRDFSEQKRARQIQSVLFNITEATGSAEDLDELLKIIHNQLGTLIDTTNFYVALYDEESGLYSFPYIVDELEEDDTFTPQELKKSLTDYVRRTGLPLLADEKTHKKLMKSGEVDLVGTESKIWIGAPLKTPDSVIGVVVVQSYKNDMIYSESDMELLSYISEHIAMAIHRKRADEQIKSSLKEKDVLLKEIHHRVKNNMQIISSLLRLQSKEIQDEITQKIFDVSQNRIRSIALIHETLYQSEDLGRIDFTRYLQKLATHLISIYRPKGQGIELKLEAKNIFLDINRAIPCGLIINELVSNSLKHAFLGDRQGEIHIILESKDGKYKLQVKDTGVGFPEEVDFKETESLGLQIVNDLVMQLEGKIQLMRKGGTVFRVAF
jgi:PAS domain S-box-containing protein